MPENEVDSNNVSLDPRALQVLLEAVDAATKRGAFSIQEVGNIANAYDHTSTVLTNLSKAQNPPQQSVQAPAPAAAEKKTSKSKGDKE